MSGEHNSTILVIDFGSSTIKVGFSGEEAPKLVFPSVIGVPKYKSKSRQSKTYVGKEAIENREILHLTYPIKYGVCDDESLILFINYIIEKLKINPEEYSVITTEPIFNPLSNKERMYKILLSNFKFEAVHIEYQGILSLYAAGTSTGTVLLLGDSYSIALSIYHGQLMKRSIKRLNLGGRDVTEHLIQNLRVNGHTNLDCSDGYQIVKNIKETSCLIVDDFEYKNNEQSNENTVYYQAPNEVISVNKIRFISPEILFTPKIVGIEHGGLAELVYESVFSCDVDCRFDLVKNIFLMGGNSKLNGLQKRLEKELSNLFPCSLRINVIALPDREYGDWLGASILSSHFNFFKHCGIYREAYNEDYVKERVAGQAFY